MKRLRIGIDVIRIDLAKLRILVVEDNQNMRRLVRTLLSGLGCRQIFEAEDGAAGLELFQYHAPDIVICDWVMPIMDGVELTRAIRRSGHANAYVPIIVLSGYSERSRVTQARDAGVTEFIVKPVSPKSLYYRIVSVVAQPRPFIETPSFFGPDRRRTASNPNHQGPRRRKGEPGGPERMVI
jgi:two-component system, chemotaxis family, chemotaxis protein CheY